MFNKGFAPIIILIAALLIAGLGGYIYFQSQDNPTINTTTTIVGPDIIATTTTTTITTTTTTTVPSTTTTSTVYPTTTTKTVLPTTTITIIVQCEDSVTFTYKGNLVTYGTVESQGRCWLDRNLGASRVATAHNDSLAYGDLFQWGRLDDGHQERDSEITFELSGSDKPGHSNFIIVDSKPYNWRDSQNDNLWQGVSGINNPCPLGWRIPTEAEWDFERASWSEQNAGGAFISSLKLTAAGRRTFSSDSPYQSPQGVSSEGAYWSSTVSDVYASSLYFDLFAALFSDVSNSYVGFGGNAAIFDENYRALGSSIRCIKD